MNIAIELTGGIGKHICATSLIRWIKERFPKRKIIVISAYPEIFEYNPKIWRNLRMGQSYLFEDYIKGADLRNGEPYKLEEYYREKNKMHINRLFPKAYGFNRYNENPEMEVFLTKGEEMDGKVFCMQNAPLITFQPFGGLPPGMQPNRMKMDTDQRDMPAELAAKVAGKLIQRGFRVLQIRGPSEMPINGTIQLNLPFRNLLPISKHSVAHVGIDSSMMHGAAAFKKPQLIFWGHTHKDNLGYKYEGFFDAFKEGGMHCRPHVQMQDQAGMFPYKDEREGSEFKYTDLELEGYIEMLVNYIRNKEVKNGNIKESQLRGLENQGMAQGKQGISKVDCVHCHGADSADQRGIESDCGSGNKTTA